MIICNVDHLDVRLVSLNQEASAQFLYGGAAFYEILAALEKKQLLIAAKAATKALKSFDSAVRSFSSLAEKIQSTDIGNLTRQIDFKDAALTVHLSPDSDMIANLNTELVRGNLHTLFVMFANQIADLSGKLRDFADRASGSNVILDDEYRLAHELLRDWGVLIDEGQYISSVCLAAATQRSVVY